MKDRAFRPPEERYDDTVLRRVIAWVGVGALVAAAGVVAVMVTADGEEVAPPPSADPSVALPAAVDAGFLLTGEISLQAEAFSETETGCSGTGPYSLVGSVYGSVCVVLRSVFISSHGLREKRDEGATI